MRFWTALITIGMLALFAGGTQANETEGLTGRDWDDSHMRTRYGPATSPIGPETSIALKIEAEGVRTLPASETRPWRSGPAVGSKVRSAAPTRAGIDRLRTRRTLSDPRPTSRRSQSQPTGGPH